MDYEYYDDTLEIYNSEGDVNYRFEDDLAESILQGKGPDQVYTYSDGFYDEEIEKCPYIPNYLIILLFISSTSFIFPIS